MKKPTKPSLPSPPRAPDSHVWISRYRVVENDTDNVSFSGFYDGNDGEAEINAKLILSVAEELKKVLAEVPEDKINSVTVGFERHSCRISYMEQVENPRFDLEQKNYKANYKKYEQHMKDYEFHMRAYAEELKDYEAWRIKHEYEQAKIRFEQLQEEERKRG